MTGERLGRVGRLLAIPLVPVVGIWEATKATVRLVAAAVRWTGDALGWVIGSVGRFARLVVRTLTWAPRMIYRGLARVVQIGQQTIAWTWGMIVSAGHAMSRVASTVGAAIIRPARVVVRGAVAVVRRVG
ncbi:MAG: hypothetical protein ACRD0U_17350, partial [Acidimicrobiales bacterium]